jgi:VIT1/CCC1 family predicted Fe2+/Mn2+ transporter
MRKFQRAEETESALYMRVAAREKIEKNKEILLQIASQEKEHALIWKRYTGEDIKPSGFKIFIYSLLYIVFGYVFIVRLKERGEYAVVKSYSLFEKEIPEIKDIIEHEKAHAQKLAAILDEERLQYVGATVLGLNDALVEVSGALAGLTFALANTKIVAVAAIITGVSATLSMAASNYLAERSEGNPRAVKASIYTGASYILTVIVLILPYLLLPNDMYIAAFLIMIAIMFAVIVIFNYYISVAKAEPFFKRFSEMASVCVIVATISFALGVAAKHFFNISV